MLKKNNVFNSPIIISLLITVCVAVICISLLSPLHYAYAEDNGGYTPKLVYYNQIANYYSRANEYYNMGSLDSDGYCNIGLTNTSIYWARIYLYSSDNTISSSHKYYFRYNSNWGTGATLYLGSGSSNPTAMPSGSSCIYTGYDTYQFNLENYFVNYPTGSIKVRWLMVDLTKMGIDNYTLEQCDNFFSAPYYSYSKGTPYYVYDNAAAGQIAEFSSYEFAINSGNLQNFDAYGSYTSTNSSNGNLELYTPINFTDENRAGFVRYNFNVSIPAGAKVTIKADNCYSMHAFSIWTDAGPSDQWFYFYTQNNNPIQKSIITEYTTTYFYIWFYSNGSTGTPAITFNNLKLEIEFTTNMNDLLQEAYNNGANEMKSFYSEGNAGYQQIYQIGYNNGLAQTDNVVGNAWDFIGGTFTSLGSLFSIEVMPNITLGVFIAIPLLLGLLLFILKITRG